MSEGGKSTTRTTSSGGTTSNLSYLYDSDDSDTYYNPHYGYEPYWPQGDWVFEEPRDKPHNVTTTKIPMVCGEECNYLYRNITKVCAHRANNIIYHGCWWEHCSGKEVDDLTQGFETYDTYCGFLDKQCRTGNETRLVFVHVGECLKSQDLWYKPLFKATQPVSRLKSYLSTLMETFKNLSTTPFG